MAAAPHVLLVGGGGREHALLWALAADCASVTVAPGNAGCVAPPHAPRCAVDTDPAATVPELLALCARRRPDLVVVGPEAPLADGLAGACAPATRCPPARLPAARPQPAARRPPHPLARPTTA